MLPMLGDRRDLAQTDQDAVGHGLSAGVGVNRLSEQVFVFRDFAPFGDFADTPEGQSGG